MKLGFIGAGNIAAAIIGGITKANYTLGKDIFIYDINKTAACAFKEEGLQICDSVLEAVAADILFITVKPNVYPQILKEIGEVKNKTIVTVAPGIKINMVAAMLDESCCVIRTMPNTPIMAGEGLTLIAKDDKVQESVFSYVSGIFEAGGKVIELKEELMDAGVGITSSSPAYVYMFIEALKDAAVLNGIDHENALIMAAQAVYGAAKMVLQSKEHPAVLKDRVCSPGGTTICALKELEDKGFRSAVISAAEACYRKIKS